MKEQTIYSKKFKGDKGNYGWPVEFDATGGYVAINQVSHDMTSRILLSPSQYKALLRFVRATSPQGDATHE